MYKKNFGAQKKFECTKKFWVREKQFWVHKTKKIWVYKKKIRVYKKIDAQKKFG